MSKEYVTRIWVEGTHLYALTKQGKTASYNLASFKGFRRATPQQLRNFVVLNGTDIHWPDLDEDINLEGMLYDNGLCPLTETEDSVVYRPIPEGHDCVAEPTPQP